MTNFIEGNQHDVAEKYLREAFAKGLLAGSSYLKPDPEVVDCVEITGLAMEKLKHPLCRYSALMLNDGRMVTLKYIGLTDTDQFEESLILLSDLPILPVKESRHKAIVTVINRNTESSCWKWYHVFTDNPHLYHAYTKVADNGKFDPIGMYIDAILTGRKIKLKPGYHAYITKAQRISFQEFHHIFQKGKPDVNATSSFTWRLREAVGELSPQR